MRQRIAWLFVALCLPLLGLWHFYRVAGWAGPAAPYEVIINEWSQGNGGDREWVELLVITGPVDLRGWDLGDESAGDLAFTNHALWSSVPSGSLIVVYNGDSPDSILPPTIAISVDRNTLGPPASLPAGSGVSYDPPNIHLYCTQFVTIQVRNL